MKNAIAVTLFFALLLAACGQVKADVPDNPEAQATRVLVERYMAANLAYDADGLMALYADDIFWMDYGLNDGPLDRGLLDYGVREAMADKGFKLKFESYLVTPDGRFAVLQALFSMPAALTDKWASAPSVAVLEFEDGRIVNETWYYDGSVFH